MPLALTFWFAYLSFWLDARYCYETVARFAKCPGSETESVNAAASARTYSLNAAYRLSSFPEADSRCRGRSADTTLDHADELK